MTLIKDTQEGQSKHTHLLCCVGSDIGIGSRSVSIYLLYVLHTSAKQLCDETD